MRTAARERPGMHKRVCPWSLPALLATLTVALGAGCAGNAAGKPLGAQTPSREWRLVEGDDGPDIDQLVESFYGADFQLPAMQGRIDAALARHPGSATV